MAPVNGRASNPPDVIGGSSYRFICNLGRGGMADVQLALQTSRAGVERLVVLKRARSELASQPEFAAMFLEEARIAATLSHQNVVQTYEVGQDEHGYFLVLEFLRGQSYGTILSTAGYADYRVSLEVLSNALLGLEYAHQLKHLSGREMGLVHRDVSPPNIFVTYDGQVKVLDFGIAKALDSTIETDTGIIKGKVAYMSPEQMHGESVDSRADLYAVGVMLWEATAGGRRFPGIPDVAVVSAVSSQRAPITPGAAERGLPALADRICERALAQDPAQRYSSAAQFHEDLSALTELVGGRLAPRALGQYVSALFATERDELQRRIEAGLQQPVAVHSTPSDPFLTGRRDSRPMTRVLPQREVRAATPLSATVQRDPLTAPGLQTDTSRAPQPNGPSWKLRAGLAGAVLLGVLYFVASHLLPSATSAARAAASPLASAAPSPAPLVTPDAVMSAAPSANAPAAPLPASTPDPHGSVKLKPVKAKPAAAAHKAPVKAPASSAAKDGLDRSNPWGS
jgi:serine/threonine protein kinase